MKTVITVTVNPCIDISAKVSTLIPDRKLSCTDLRKEPGGGGINVSRVLQRFGITAKAIYLAGGYTGEFFTEMLLMENVDTHVVKTKNHTRENFVIAEVSKSVQYRFGMPGPLISSDEWQQCLEALRLVENVEYIVASGSLAQGLPEDYFAQIARITKAKNAKLILDTSGEPLRAALNEGIYMIKPNLRELSFISGVPDLDQQSAVEAARSIIAKKQCEVVVVSMAAGGALLVTEKISEHVKAPSVEIKSTVGAGDSMVAGIVLALTQNKPFTEALQYGVACGTATTMNEGTSLCKPSDVEFLFKLISNG